MKNFFSGGGDPLERLISTEERNERKAKREEIKVSICNGQLVVCLSLPAVSLFGIVERIEKASGISNKLRVIADELES